MQRLEESWIAKHRNSKEGKCLEILSKGNESQGIVMSKQDMEETKMEGNTYKKINETIHTMTVKLTFTEDILGTASANPEIHEEFIASKAPDAKSREEEVESLGADEVFEKGMTVFPKDDGVPFFWDYQIKGFFKDTCGMLRKVKDTRSSKIKAYKKEIDGLVFIKERKIPIEFDGEISICQRPLRGQTAQGERIALASSESIPAGATIEFTVQVLDKSYLDNIREWLDYGELRGMGQWRNSGKGRFTWEEV